MSRFGHLRELKELKSLAPFLQQVAAQTHCVVQLLQADGAPICAGGPDSTCTDAECCLRVRPAKIVMSWQKHGTLLDPWPTTCPAGKALLILPMHRGDRMDGVLAVCAPAPEHYAFLTSVAAMINAYSALA